MILTNLALALSVISGAAARITRPVRYDNQLLVRVYNDNNNFNELRQLFTEEYDVFSHGKDSITVRLGRDQLNKIRPNLKHYKIVNYNVQEAIDAETQRLNTPQLQAADWFAEFHPFDQIVSYFKDLSTKYPEVVSVVDSIGKTVEGRDIPMVTVTGKNKPDKPVIFMQGMQHAREWIASSTIQYIVTAFASSYNNDTEITQLLDNIQFVFIPASNPDGYVYTWTKDRLWRKNRNLVNGTAYGIDTNRNYPDHWGNDEGSSGSPYSQTYRGPYPASEPETRALMNAFNSLKSRLIGSIDLHSYSELLLRPYGWTQENSPDEQQFYKLGELIRTAVSSYNGTEYVNEHTIDLYPVSGAASDWFYGNSTSKGEKKNYGITIELSPSANDPNDWGFIIPPTEIVKVGKEMLRGFMAFAKFVYENPLNEK